MVPEDLKYSTEHEWVRVEGEIASFGITHFAQESLGDIVFVSLPKVGTSLSAGDVCGEVESTKSVSDIYSPVSGVVLRINTDLDSTPETVNSDPYNAGWMVEVSVANGVSGLLSAAEYSQFLDGGV
ncbi:MAG: glycine cleavage system protein GcvH [Actinobacteria bacterium]|nr:glycine cleavage system protein GcvH [Actinomycetota bacterium]